jgi:hypothetical protein
MAWTPEERIRRTTLDGYHGLEAGDLFGILLQPRTLSRMFWVQSIVEASTARTTALVRGPAFDPGWRWDMGVAAPDFNTLRKFGLIHLGNIPGIPNRQNPNTLQPNLSPEQALELLQDRHAALNRTERRVDPLGGDVVAWTHDASRLLYVLRLQPDQPDRATVLTLNDNDKWEKIDQLNVGSLLRQRKLAVVANVASLTTTTDPLPPPNRSIPGLRASARTTVHRLIGEGNLRPSPEYRKLQAALRNDRGIWVDTSLGVQEGLGKRIRSDQLSLAALPKDLQLLQRAVAVITGGSRADRPQVFVPFGLDQRNPREMRIRPVSVTKEDATLDWDSSMVPMDLTLIERARAQGRLGMVRLQAGRPEAGASSLPDGTFDAIHRTIAQLHGRRGQTLRTDPDIIVEHLVAPGAHVLTNRSSPRFHATADRIDGVTLPIF